MAVTERGLRYWRVIGILMLLIVGWRLVFREEAEVHHHPGDFVEHLVQIDDSEKEKMMSQDDEEEGVVVHQPIDPGMEYLQDERDVHMEFGGNEHTVNLPGGFEVLRMVDGEWVTDPSVCRTREEFPEAKLKTPTGDIKISLYSESDNDPMSSKIRKSSVWELDILSTMIEILKTHRDWVFIDIGANIGVYTLSLAKAGYDVIALEPTVPNIQRMCQSLDRGEYGGIVRVIHNVVADNTGHLAIRNDHGRQHTNERIMLDELANFLLLKSVVLRLDAGEHQLKVLRGSREFFRHVKVQYLLLDLPEKFQNTKEHKDIVEFLTRENMKPALPSNPKLYLTVSELDKWPSTVLWVNMNVNMQRDL